MAILSISIPLLGVEAGKQVRLLAATRFGKHPASRPISEPIPG